MSAIDSDRLARELGNGYDEYHSNFKRIRFEFQECGADEIQDAFDLSCGWGAQKMNGFESGLEVANPAEALKDQQGIFEAISPYGHVFRVR